jgi:hypothetical protein
MNDKNHAPRPRLCAECDASMSEAIGRAVDQDVVLHCPHEATLVFAQVRGGLVRHWIFDGPVTPEAALAAVARHARMLEKAGRIAPAPGDGDVH